MTCLRTSASHPKFKPHQRYNHAYGLLYLAKKANVCQTLQQNGGCFMPVSVTHSHLIYAALKACDIKIISALPETWLVHLIRIADEDPEMTLVRLAKEEEGIGISAGAHLAGVKSALLMQNH